MTASRFGLRRQQPGAPLDRVGGVRKEERERPVSPPRVVPQQEKPPVMITPRGTTLESKVRPSNEFTVEEMRVQLAAVAGPMRLFASDRRFIRTFNNDQNTQQLVKGLNCPVFVRVSPADDAEGTRRFNFTDGAAGSEQTGDSLVMPDEGFYSCVVLPGESLYATTLADFPTVGDTEYKLKIEVVTV
jgi:hypothetical protein